MSIRGFWIVPRKLWFQPLTDVHCSAGGTFALYSYLCQHVNVGQHVDKHYKRLDSDKKLTHFSKRSLVNSATRHMLVRSQLARKILLFIVLMGTCMIIGDGVLTPAISGLSILGQGDSPDELEQKCADLAASVAIEVHVVHLIYGS